MTKLGSMVSAAAMVGLVAASAVQAQTPTPTTATSTCVGDCKNNDTVDIADLVVGVNIALGVQQLAACPAFDCMHDGTVTVTCLVQGVNNALLGCGFVTATPTPTTSGGVVPTATPTPTTGSTVRVFTIDSLVTSQQNSDTPGSGLFNGNPLGGLNVAATISPGPLKLVLGAADANGVAPLSLQSDVAVAIDIALDTSCVCLKMMAQGSAGHLNCGSGQVPYDTTITQTAASGTGWTIQTGQGTPAGKGNGDLVVTALFANVTSDMISGGCVAGACCMKVDCLTFAYTDPPNQFPFTTTKANSMVEGAGAAFSTSGAPFDCAHFTTPGSGGELVSGVAMSTVIGPTADSLRLSE